MLTKLLASGAILLLAGCAHPAQPTGMEPSNFSTLNPSFRDCIVGYTIFTFPRGTGPGSVPREWGQSPGAGSDVRVELLDCKKVSWGPFERGPIQMMIELHNKGDLPPQCAEKRPDFIYNLERMLISDSDLAHYVNTTYGMVANFGTVMVNVTKPSESFTSYSWSWGEPGSKFSTLTLGNSDTVAPSTDRAVERWIWMNGSGLGMFDVSQSYVAGVELSVAPGTMHPPMLYAQVVPSGAYIGLGDSGSNFQATSKYYKFGDQLCKQPLVSSQ